MNRRSENQIWIKEPLWEYMESGEILQNQGRKTGWNFQILWKKMFSITSVSCSTEVGDFTSSSWILWNRSLFKSWF